MPQKGSTKTRWTEEEDAIIAEGYSQCLHYKKIQEQLLPHKSEHAVKKRIKNTFGLERSDEYLDYLKRADGRVHYNESKFENNTIELFYWIGFLAADGCVIKNGRNYTLCLGLKDKESILKYNEFVECDRCIWRPASMVYECRFSITNKTYNILKNKFNITPKKTFDLLPPENMTEKETLAYIAGALDGDGCCGIKKSTDYTGVVREYPCLSIVSASKIFIEWFKKNIEAHTPTTREIQDRRTYYTYSVSYIHLTDFLKVLIDLNLPLMERKIPKTYEYFKEMSAEKRLDEIQKLEDRNSLYKICSVCNENKLKSEFGTDNRLLEGITNKCTTCSNSYANANQRRLKEEREKNGGPSIPKCKTCPKCNERKESNQFFKKAHSANGLSSYCKECSRIRKKEYRERVRKMGGKPK